MPSTVPLGRPVSFQMVTMTGLCARRTSDRSMRKRLFQTLEAAPHVMMTSLQEITAATMATAVVVVAIIHSSRDS